MPLTQSLPLSQSSPPPAQQVEAEGFEVQSLALNPGWRTTDGATQPCCSDRGEQVEALGPECECWRFMSGAGRRGAQLKAGDS